MKKMSIRDGCQSVGADMIRSGKTEVSVFQDFYATVYIAGFAMICADDATIQIQDNDMDKNLKYARKASMNRSISRLRDRFLLIILQDDPLIRQALLDRLCSHIAAYLVSIRPGRSPARKSPRNKRFFIAKKSVLP